MADNTANNKRIAKNTLLLYIRSIFLIFIGLYTSRVILLSLGVEDFGIYNVIGGVVTMFTMISSSMTAASQRFISYALGEGDATKLRKIFSTSVTLHIIIAVGVTLLIEIFGSWFFYTKLNIPSQRMDVAFWVLQLSIATLFVNILSVPFNSAIIAHEKLSAFAYLSILEGILKLVIALCLILATFDYLLLYAILMFMVSVLIQSVYVIYSKTKFAETRHIRLALEHQIFKEMFSFASWNMLGSASFLLRNQGVDILLNLFFGVTINAAKGICNQVQASVYQFVTNFQTAVTPQLTMSVAQQNFSRTHELIIRGGRYSFYMLSLFAVPLIVATPEILELWLKKVPNYSVIFVRWTLVYLLLDTLSRFLINAVLAYGKIKVYQIVVGITKILTLPFVYIWLLLGGDPVSGILANIIIEIGCLAFRLYFNKKYNGLSCIDYICKTILPCWGIFILALIPSLIIRSHITTNIFFLSADSIIITLVVIACFGFNKEERQTGRNKMMCYFTRIYTKTFRPNT